jgi:hypothetical protein
MCCIADVLDKATNTTKLDTYADHSAAMGICCMARCHNTPHAWQMGWLAVTQVGKLGFGGI